jgi:hypothetical protein
LERATGWRVCSGHWRPIGAAIACCCLGFAPSSSAQTALRVDARASHEPHDGSDWNHAFQTLQEALAAASDPATTYHILIAGGGYRPDETALGVHSGSRAATFLIRNKVSLLGGFAGVEDDPSTDVRNIDRYATELSGDIGLPDEPTDNSFHVVTVDGTVSSASVLDGFDVVDGNATGAPHPAGSCIYSPDGGNPRLVNVNATRGRAFSGGAVYINAPGRAVTITGRKHAFSDTATHQTGRSGVFTGTCADGDTWTDGPGGAMYVRSATLAISQCLVIGETGGNGGGIFADCSASILVRDVYQQSSIAGRGDGNFGHGGGVYVASPLVTLRDCYFVKCSAQDNRPCATATLGTFGGAARIVSQWARIRGCRFHRGYAGYGAGAAIAGNSLDIVNSMFTGFNEAAWRGGGVYANGLARADIVNSLVDGAAAMLVRLGAPCGDIGSGEGGGIALVDCQTATLSSCTIVNCRATQRGAGVLASGPTALAVANTIMWYQGWDPQGPQGSPCERDLAAVDGAGAAVTYSNIHHGWNGLGVIHDDPQFRFVKPNIYTLAPSSPCIDAGDNDALPADVLDLDGDNNTTEPLPVDLLYNRRRVDISAVTDTGHGSAPIVDIGAYEAQVLPCIAGRNGNGAFTPADVALFVTQWQLDLDNHTLITDIDNNGYV